MKRLLIAATVSAGLVLAGCGGNDDPGDARDGASSETTAEESPLAEAYDACADQMVGNPLDENLQFPAGDIMTVDDTSLVVDGAGDQFASAQAGGCVLEELQAPGSVVSKVESTTALMGRQTDSWETFEASWSFHPDNGLDLVVELEE